MGFVTEKANMNGIYGGVSTTKTGQHYLYILTPGPKVNKVRLVTGIPTDVSSRIPFGAAVDCVLTNADQKFSDFNGCFIDAASATIKPSELAK